MRGINKTIVQELEKAKRTISVLENELGSERARLRSLVTEQERMQREKKQILTDLTRTESVGFDFWLRSDVMKSDGTVGYGRCQTTAAAFQEREQRT